MILPQDISPASVACLLRRVLLGLYALVTLKHPLTQTSSSPADRGHLAGLRPYSTSHIQLQEQRRGLYER